MSQLFCGHGPSKQPPLPQLTSHPKQHLGFFYCFHAFRNSEKPQALSQPNHCGNDLAALALVGHRMHKGAIDFQLVERQRLQLREA